MDAEKPGVGSKRHTGPAPAAKPPVWSRSTATAHGPRARDAGRRVRGERLLRLATITILLSAGTAKPAIRAEHAFGRAIVNGVTTTQDGRTFVVLQPLSVSQPKVAEVVGKTLRPFPDAAWNAWRPGESGVGSFVGANSLRVERDGSLWVVDRGAPGFGGKHVPHGAKLIRFDIANRRATRIYDLEAASKPSSFMDDVRLSGDHAYLTDAGDPGLVVLDLNTGAARRVLERRDSTTARRQLRAEGRPVISAGGTPVVLNADQIEITPDGRWVLFQAASGPMYRVARNLLDNASLDPATLDRRVELFADTPSTGGTAMDADGNIYLSDAERSRILRISPAGKMTIVAQDPRLAWVDAMWIDRNGRLLMPAAQLDRLAPLNRGLDEVEWPMRIYSLEIGARHLRS